MACVNHPEACMAGLAYSVVVVVGLLGFEDAVVAVGFTFVIPAVCD